MRAIMYHYVRPDDPGFPYFRHLPLSEFLHQLEELGRNFHWVTRKELLSAIANGKPVEQGVILTFDDGFADHHSYVYPELARRRIPGIFYIATGPLSTGRLLEVHRVHLLLGRHGGEKIYDYLRQILEPSMLSHAHVEEFFTKPYRAQTNDQWTTEVKRILNYLIDYSARPTVMSALVNEFLPDEREIAERFYVNPEQLREMHANGMIIGSHTESHPCLSKLNATEQRREIAESFGCLEEILGPLPIKTFCYPYGGSHSFTVDTVGLLEAIGCRFSFSVEYRDIEAKDLTDRRQALPRYDCNMARAFTNPSLSGRS